MNRTIKDATLKDVRYAAIDSPRPHLLTFVRIYNFARRLKALRWKTPFEVMAQAWKKDPPIVNKDPHHLIPGPGTLEQS
jgi:hypothetical protein